MWLAAFAQNCHWHLLSDLHAVSSKTEHPRLSTLSIPKHGVCINGAGSDGDKAHPTVVLAVADAGFAFTLTWDSYGKMSGYGIITLAEVWLHETPE